MTQGEHDLVQALLEYGRTEEQSLAWSCDRLRELIDKAPSEAWPIVLRAVHESTDDLDLNWVAAIAVEEFLAHHGDEYLAAVLAQAEEDEAFRVALGWVYPIEPMSARVKEAINKVAIRKPPP